MNLSKRRVLLGLGATAAVSGGILGTGALTSIEATRSIEIDAAGDSAAFLGLYDIDGGSFVTSTDDTLAIALDSSLSGADGTGVNHGSGSSDVATTTIDPAFSIKNQGADTMYVQIDHEGNTSSGNDVQFIGVDDANDSATLDADQTPNDVIASASDPSFIDRDGTTAVTTDLDSGGTTTTVNSGGYVTMPSSSIIDVVLQIASDNTTTGEIINSATIQAYSDSGASGLYSTAVSTP